MDVACARSCGCSQGVDVHDAPQADPPPTKTACVETWGCQMNVYDSRRMQDLLQAHGYKCVRDAKQAGLVILNTCHIRAKAAEKVYSRLGRLVAEDRVRERVRILAVSGCVAQAEGAEIFRRVPSVRLVFGPQTLHRLPQLLARVEAGESRVADLSFPKEEKFDSLPEEGQSPGVSAFLTVQEGCDKFCTFCVVPYTRGAEVSRNANAILQEARRLVSRGARELVLLGQNVNAWRGSGADGKTWNFARLLRFLVEKIPEMICLRYTTSHPRDVDESLIAAHREITQLAPFLHLPVQSGSDRILASMRRRHSVEDYLRIIDALREAREDIAFSSDFIVGFPGEEDKDFAQTLALVRRVKFTQGYTFAYSRRPGTPAAGLNEQVSACRKSARLQALQQLLQAQTEAFNQSCVGRKVRILFEKKARHNGQVQGRSPWMQSVHAFGARPGEACEVRITQAGRHSLHAELAT